MERRFKRALALAQVARQSWRQTMKRIFAIGLTFGALLTASTALAQPIQIPGDDGYTRLARWEAHLDDSIANAVRNRSINAFRAWRIQKDLDAIEVHVLQSHYEGGNGIDRSEFRLYASQLRDIGRQLGEQDWGARNIYGNGWSDTGDDRDMDRGDHSGPPAGNYYREGDYERSCHQGNVAAGTIFGALAGGLIGSAASHGNGGAVAGGVILGGLVGNTLARDVDCDDQRYAFNTYGEALNGEVGREYRWSHNSNYGTFTSTREYRDGGNVCRDFHTVTYRGGQRFDRDGTACREADGN